MKKSVLAIILTVILSACQTTTIDVNKYTQTESFVAKDLLISPAVVRAKMAEDNTNACPSMFTDLNIFRFTSLPRSGKAASKDGGESWGAKDVYISAITRASLVYLTTQNEKAARYVISTLEEYAKKDAWAFNSGDNHWDNIYSVSNLTIPTLAAWSIIRKSPSITNKQHTVIVKWLGDIVDRSLSFDSGAKKNNKMYLRNTIQIQWGVLTNNKTLFEQGINGVLYAVENMREDGSLPYETARGSWAIKYTWHATASLITNAELALQQGIDLYSININGKTLHTAIDYALSLNNDKTIMQKYTQDHQVALSWNKEWITTYTTRFMKRKTPTTENEPYNNGLVSMMGNCLAWLKYQ